MHNPPHPGKVIKELCLEPLGISVTDAAKAFDTSPESWLNQQMQYDLWMAEQNLGELNIENIEYSKIHVIP